jgi:hypothetical protein
MLTGLSIAMNQKTHLKIKCGLLSPKHCQAIGSAVWLFMYILDRADWEDGTLRGYTDADAAEDLGSPRLTIKKWRARLARHNYIASRQGLHSQTLYVNKWTNPRQKWGAELPDEARCRVQDVPFDGAQDSARDSGVQTASPEIYIDAEMQRQFEKITGMLTFPSRSREQDLTRLRAIAKANHGDAVRYCARFFQEWMRRGYAKSNTAWLDWAVAGDIPTQRTRRTSRRKEQEDANPSGPLEYSQADIAFADAIIAAHTE